MRASLTCTIFPGLAVAAAALALSGCDVPSYDWNVNPNPVLDMAADLSVATPSPTVDLAAPPDLATPPDLAVAPDLSSPQDAQAPGDAAPPGDGAAAGDGAPNPDR